VKLEKLKIYSLMYGISKSIYTDDCTHEAKFCSLIGVDSLIYESIPIQTVVLLKFCSMMGFSSLLYESL